MFDPTRLAIVDEINGNLLVRGNAPIDSDDNFAYLDVFKALNLQKHYASFITLNLMDNTGERKSWAVDFSAYGQDINNFPKTIWPPYINVPGWDPSKPYGSTLRYSLGQVPGNLYWWPIEGLPEGEYDLNTFLHSPGWDFVGCIDLLRKIAKTSKNSIIYFHCTLGADRTGALHTGYLIAEKKMNLQLALETAGSSTSAGMPSQAYINLVTKYSENL